MKKIYSFLIVLLSLLSASDSIAQNPHPWELGLNGGAAWLKSDVKMKKLGPGFGFTFGQTYCYNETSPLFWGWRFRYLGSTTYGQDYQKSFGLKNNFALNGQNDTTLNYFSNGGYVYQNYKTSLSEFSLEVKIGANQLRKKTNILMYVFGGAGLTKAVTKLDQLDENNMRYNYNLVDSAGNGSKSDILSRLNDIYDGSYETLAEGSKNPKWRFMPYVGVGLGYQFTKGFSMGFEHKMTWTRNDLVDGQQWTSTNENTGTNDMYHYSSVWMKFSFGGKGRTTSTTTTTNSNTNNNVNTYTNTNTNTTTTTNSTVNTTTTSAVEVPKITFTSPTSNPFSTTQNTITITANVLNVANSSGINLIYNGATVNGFTYSNNVLTYTTPLVVGNNNFVVNATNTSGTVTASTNVTYSAPVVSTPAPIVAITNPTANPFNTSQGIIIVNGTVQNISSKSQMQVTVNGVVDNNFIYTPSTKTFSVSANLIPGANAFVISATNAGGTDSRSVTVIYQQQIIQNTAPAPVVTILSPNVNPYTVSTPTTNVVASVMNVTSQSQIVLTQNGIITPFSFNVNSHQLSYNALLAVGANTITITATNSGGSDTKTATVIYNKPVTVAQPIVTITNPSTAVTNSTLSPTPINAIVQNVTAIGQLAVTVNGGPVMASALNFNVASGQLSFNANLIVGANTITVSATNIAGMDSKSITIVYEQAAPPVMPPSVTITNPVANPFTTTLSTQMVNANVLNVNSQNQISVSLNGAAIPFNFNAASHQLSLTANLIQGANVVSITATNAVNSDSKSITIIYNKPATVPAPVVTITSPAASPFTTTTNTVAIGATIQNVTAVGQLAVTVNGGPVMTSALNFNSTTGQLNFNANLVQGANTITVSATNIAGADSKTKTVIYNQPAPVVVPPVITVITPYANPSSTSVNSETVSATIANVNASNQITVSLNGVNSNFNYNALTHQLNFVANLIVGANTVVITATNAAGADSKTITFNYSIPVQLLPPVVSFITPAAATETSNAATYAVVAKALNVNTSNQVTVTVNGTAITNFVMQPITKKISFTANLRMGANVITVSATNNSGTDTKSVTINYVRVIDVMSPDTLNTPNVGRPNKPNLTLGTPNTASLPLVTVGLPAVSPFTTPDATYTIGGSITGVLSAANIVIKQNNVVVPFNYLTNKKTFSATLNLANGTNTILIEATNASGTKTQTIVINKQ